MKSILPITVAGLALTTAATQAAVVNGVNVEASVALQDGTPAKNYRNVTYDLSTTLVDWNLFNGTSITTPVDSKSGASILGNYVAGGATIVDSGSANSLAFSWADGDPTAVSAGTDRGVGTSGVTGGGHYTGAFLTWDVTLPALSGGVTGYQMQYYTVEKRLASSLQIDDSGFTSLASKTGNDEDHLRLWTIDMTAYAGSPTLTFRHNLDSTFGTANVFAFGGITVAEVSAVPEPSSAALLGLGGLALILRRRK